MRDISIVVNARLGSSRLPQKMIRPFGGSSLLKIALERLCKIRIKNKYLAAAEDQIIEVYEPFRDEIQLLPRTKESVAPSKERPDFSVAFSHYNLIPDDYILTANACFPFVKPSTYEDAIDFFKSSDCKTMTSVVKHGNIFFDSKKSPINLLLPHNASTQWNDDVYEMAHVFHIFDKNFFMENGYFWDYSPSNPEFFEVSVRECFDVDTLEEFDICEKLYVAGYKA